jgi:hypothetical protein
MIQYSAFRQLAKECPGPLVRICINFCSKPLVHRFIAQDHLCVFASNFFQSHSCAASSPRTTCADLQRVLFKATRAQLHRPGPLVRIFKYFFSKPLVRSFIARDHLCGSAKTFVQSHSCTASSPHSSLYHLQAVFIRISEKDCRAPTLRRGILDACSHGILL